MGEPKKKKIRYLTNGVHAKGCYIKAWKERRDMIVQVWWSGKAEGEPDGDWLMPGIFGMANIDQAILQTKKPK